jgi:hypothetical protein
VLRHQLGQNRVLRLDVFLQVMQSAPGQRNGWLAVFARTLQPRSRRTPSASLKRPSAEVPLHRTTSRWAPSPASAASGWRPSLLARIASVASSCVLSIILTGGGTPSPFPTEPEGSGLLSNEPTTNRNSAGSLALWQVISPDPTYREFSVSVRLRELVLVGWSSVAV